MKQLPEGFYGVAQLLISNMKEDLMKEEGDFYHMTLKQMDQWKIQDIIHFKCLMEQF